MKKSQTKELGKYLGYGLALYALIVVGGIVAVEVISGINGVVILSFWDKALLLLPIYAFCGYQLVWIAYNIQTGKWKKQ